MKNITLFVLLLSAFQVKGQHTFLKAKGGVFFMHDNAYLGIEPMIEQFFKEKHAIQVSYLHGVPFSRFANDGGDGKIDLVILEYKNFFHKPKKDMLRAYYWSIIGNYGKSSHASGWAYGYSKSQYWGLGGAVGKFFPFARIFSFNPHIGFCLESVHTKGKYSKDPDTMKNLIDYEYNSIEVFPRIGFALGVKISEIWEKKK